MQVIMTPRLVLKPLTAADAPSMFELLLDPRIHEYLDQGPPESVEALCAHYLKLERRTSPDGSEQWLNWVVQDTEGRPLGFVQATIESPTRTWVAFVFARQHWGRGYAHEATQAMIDCLASVYGAKRCLATVEADNDRSIGLLNRLAFRLSTGAEAAEHVLTATERLFIRQA
jgi:RimJ/RimL family protein N-acetyltransferase